MSNVEVHIEWDGLTQRVGLLRQNRGRRGETISFEYEDAWLKNANCFSLEPALSLTSGTDIASFSSCCSFRISANRSAIAMRMVRTPFAADISDETLLRVAG
jgi:hypothetical protein